MKHFPELRYHEPRYDLRGHAMQLPQLEGSIAFLSVSHKNVIRGMHYQVGEHAQGKLVTVMRGRVFDVLVDLRKSSPDYGNWMEYNLVGPHVSLWVPPGYAHGFAALEDYTTVHYQLLGAHNPQAERVLYAFDSTVRVSWPVPRDAAILSERDWAGVDWEFTEKFE